MPNHTLTRLTGNGTQQTFPLIEYHVIPHGERWDIERDDEFTGSFAYDLHTAIGLAIAAATRDHHRGDEVMVCVQDNDGLCRKIWP